MARYKTRKDGSRYKAWRCLRAVQYGSLHTDKAGNQVGCMGLTIRNEDAVHILYLTTQNLKYNRKRVIKNLLAIIESVIAMKLVGNEEELITEISQIVEEIVNGVEEEDAFYQEILDKMVVVDKNNIDVYLKYLPFKLSYTALE